MRLKVTPRARKDSVGGVVEGPDGPALKISVTAPADEGRANDAVIALLARAWRVPKGAIELVQGAKSRQKLVHVTADAHELLPRLDAWLKQS